MRIILPLLILFIFYTDFFAQSDLKKWSKKEISYQVENKNSGRDYSFRGDDVFEVAARSFTNVYWFFISEVDGDNCPFHPSCSTFFIESVKETNIFQAGLMFMDRFTRDFNFVGREKHYPVYNYKRFYDPVSLYQLDENKIKYLPPSFIVKDE